MARPHRSGSGADLDALATVVELIAIGISSGLGLPEAIDAAARHSAPADRCGLDDVVRATVAGVSTVDALAEWSAVGGARSELTAVLRGAERSGAAIAGELDRLAGDLRRRRRRAAEERVRRLPVTTLLPLVCCVLPAFGLLTVVPMVAVGFGRLASAP